MHLLVYIPWPLSWSLYVYLKWIIALEYLAEESLSTEDFEISSAYIGLHWILIFGSVYYQQRLIIVYWAGYMWRLYQ